MCPSHRRAWQIPATVLTTASSEPRSYGTSKACDQTGYVRCFLSLNHSWRCIRLEGRSIHPDPMKNNRDAACERDHRNFAPPPLRELGSPCSQPRFIMTVAAWQKARFRLMSPAFVMPPDASGSPDWLREGVRPTEGPTLFEDRKRVGSPTAARDVSATKASIPQHCHQMVAHWIVLSELTHLFHKGCQFLSQRCPGAQH